jgi:biopolymer transport protein ExbD
MTDIAFLLLLFFLILALSTRLTPIPITAATSAEALQAESSAVIFLGLDGSLFYEDKQISLELLPKEKEVTLLADKDTPFGKINPVLETLRKNGTTTIHCLVGQSQ